jgi:hypothetical protein
VSIHFIKSSVMLTRKVAISAAFIGVTAFAFASIGGGGNNSKAKRVSDGYIPVRTTQGFSLKSSLAYRGTIITNEQRSGNYIAFNSLVTYRTGNTTYILPNRYKVATSCQNQMRSNLQLLNLRFKLAK